MQEELLNIAALMALAVENLQFQSSIAYNESKVNASIKSLYDLKDEYFKTLSEAAK